MWKEEISYRREQKTRSNQEQTEIVWVYKKGNIVQRDKGTAKRCITRRVEKHSQR